MKTEITNINNIITPITNYDKTITIFISTLAQTKIEPKRKKSTLMKLLHEIASS